MNCLNSLLLKVGVEATIKAKAGAESAAKVGA